MKYTVTTCENKSPDWKVITLEDANGQSIGEVSVNKVSKQGEPFPKFDEIAMTTEIEGELWTSQSGKNYLFAPKPKLAPAQGGTFKGGGMKMMAEKAKNIEEAQKRKSESIAFFNATNSAIALIKEMGIAEMSESELKVKIRVWRDHFISEYENWDNIPF